MKKIHLNLSIDEDLVDKARNHSLIINKFLESKLQQYFSFIDAVNIHKKQSEGNQWTEWDLNPRPPPCEGDDLPLIYQPLSLTLKIKKEYIIISKKKINIFCPLQKSMLQQQEVFHPS